MTFVHQLRHAVRALLGQPGLLLVSTLSLGLGIGLTTAMWSGIDALLFRPPPVARPAELINVYSRRNGEQDSTPISYLDLVDLRAATRSLTDLAGTSMMLANLERDGRPSMVIGEDVTDGDYELLGVAPRLGRTFDASEFAGEGGQQVVMVSDTFWRRELAARSSAVSETLRIKGQSFEIVGVLPPGFHGLRRGLNAEIFVPISMLESVEPFGEIATEGTARGATRAQWRGYRFLTAHGRLRPGATLEQARAELDTHSAALDSIYPESNAERGVAVVEQSSVLIDPEIDRVVVPAATLALVLVGLVLLVSCANVANLLLARAHARRREIAVRLALGASRGKLLGQLLGEGLVLAVAGCAAGLVVAGAAMSWLERARIDFPIQPTIDLRLDPPVLLFALALSVGSGVFFALVPLAQTLRPGLVAALKADDSAGPPGRRLLARFATVLQPRNVLVIAQVALAHVLLVGALLLLRSTAVARARDVGFPAERLGAITIDLESAGLTRDTAAPHWQALHDALRATPGITGAAYATRVPLGLNVWNGDFYIPGHRETKEEPALALDVTDTDLGYFALLDLELIEGRLFDERDRPDTPRVAVVTQAMTDRFWPQSSALGKRFRVSAPDAPEVEIVGVLRNYKVITPGEAPRPMVHFAAAQRPNPYGVLLFRTGGNPEHVLDAARRAIAQAEPSAFVLDATTMERMRDTILLPLRLGSALLVGMGALALLLGSIGLAGLIAFWVSQRTREIGIRIALGATRERVQRLVLGRSLALVAAGSVLGIAGALLLGRLLRSVLYVPSADPRSVAAGILVLVLVALVASLAPARRAARVDPLVTLRNL